MGNAVSLFPKKNNNKTKDKCPPDELPGEVARPAPVVAPDSTPWITQPLIPPGPVVRLPPLPSPPPLPNGENTHRHAMLSHDWGEDGKNHERVRSVNEILTSMGVRTWFDEEMLERNPREEMTEGINMSTWVVVFITKRYIKKIASKTMRVTLVLRYWSHHLICDVTLARRVVLAAAACLIAY